MQVRFPRKGGLFSRPVRLLADDSGLQLGSFQLAGRTKAEKEN